MEIKDNSTLQRRNPPKKERWKPRNFERNEREKISNGEEEKDKGKEVWNPGECPAELE